VQKIHNVECTIGHIYPYKYFANYFDNYKKCFLVFHKTYCKPTFHNPSFFYFDNYIKLLPVFHINILQAYLSQWARRTQSPPQPRWWPHTCMCRPLWAWPRAGSRLSCRLTPPRQPRSCASHPLLPALHCDSSKPEHTVTGSRSE